MRNSILLFAATMCIMMFACIVHGASLDTALYKTKVILPKTVSFTFTSGGDLICPVNPNAIVKINAAGEKFRIAGNGLPLSQPYFSGEDIPAALAQMFDVQSAVVTSKGELIIADTRNRRIRKVDTRGIISTIAGAETGVRSSQIVDGKRAFGSPLPCIVQVHSVGQEIYFSTDPCTSTSYYPTDIFKITADGLIYHVAGDKEGTISSKDRKASGTKLAAFQQFTITKDGKELYIAETSANRIRKVDLKTGEISTVIGTGSSGFSGDKLPAIQALVNVPSGIAIDSYTNDIYISDSYNNRIRKVDSKSGIITTVAGVDNVVHDKMKGEGFSQDGGYAALARLDFPTYLEFAPNGDLYFIEKTGYGKLSRCPKGSVPNTKTGKCTIVQKNPFEEAADQELNLNEFIDRIVEKKSFNGKLIKSIRKALKNLRDLE
ncbi:NHL repeat domain-containing protein [Naegleria gruberi]|uniref:NHL repeat domain-containing protein n=1 Tax=Naegleria gruberi TaxID=5762 RepID=D2W2D4_NAEGR|nr:NHL repeat domain-containing protein [Naegleria gruberi]EFC36841.1 NHL repeat domain-containing protein [Naegleria gruberi]|eukprot:XP_002669585.1 NHL repeat domain-containing protein [Naegleria gruberi strain NEG-M]